MLCRCTPGAYGCTPKSCIPASGHQRRRQRSIRCLLEDNEIVDSYYHGVVIGYMAAPTLQNNKIHACGNAGVFCQDGATPTLIDNEVYKNYVGVECKDDAEPVLRGNKVHHNKMNALQVYKDAKGVYEDNDMYQNGKVRHVTRTVSVARMVYVCVASISTGQSKCRRLGAWVGGHTGVLQPRSVR